MPLSGLSIVDSVTQLVPEPDAVVAVTGSHGGVFSARAALARAARAAVFNDAGIGKDRAGVAGLDLLADRGMAAVAVDHASARIGDGRDSLARGTVSVANPPAQHLGVEVGTACAVAVRLLLSAPDPPPGPADPGEGGAGAHLASTSAPTVWALDSASLVSSAHDGCLAITGSHGGLLGAKALSAANARPLLIVFNDAGGGVDGAGWSRLPALDSVGVAAATVAAASARIGEGRSTLEEGVLSHVNARARDLGAVIGLPVRDWVDIVTAASTKQTGMGT